MISQRYENDHSTLMLHSFNDEIIGFTWKLISDLHTDDDYRRCGYATDLIIDVVHEHFDDGIYLFVRRCNGGAISLYLKCGFSVLKEYENHYLMVIGSGDLDVLKEMKFGM